MVIDNLVHQVGPFPWAFEDDILKGSFISIYMSIIGGKMLLKNDLFGTGKPRAHFATFLFYTIQ